MHDRVVQFVLTEPEPGGGTAAFLVTASGRVFAAVLPITEPSDWKEMIYPAGCAPASAKQVPLSSLALPRADSGLRRQQMDVRSVEFGPDGMTRVVVADPSRPGCMAHGATLEEAEANLVESRKLWDAPTKLALLPSEDDADGERHKGDTEAVDYARRILKDGDAGDQIYAWWLQGLLDRDLNRVPVPAIVRQAVEARARELLDDVDDDPRLSAEQRQNNEVQAAQLTAWLDGLKERGSDITAAAAALGASR